MSWIRNTDAGQTKYYAEMPAIVGTPGATVTPTTPEFYGNSRENDKINCEQNQK
jgi:hypothetical protein